MYIDGSNPKSKICPKLTDIYINPSNKQKRRVKYAAKILSHSVCASLTFACSCGTINGQVTAELVDFMDQLLNSLNVTFKSSKPLNRAVTDESKHFQF